MALYNWDEDWKEESAYVSNAAGAFGMFDLNTEFAPPSFIGEADYPNDNGMSFEYSAMDMDEEPNRRDLQTGYYNNTSFGYAHTPTMNNFPSYAPRGNRPASSNVELTALKREIKQEPSYSTIPRPYQQRRSSEQSVSNGTAGARPLVSGDVALVVHSQPPVEVRTRTPSEKRSFSASVTLLGPWKSLGGKSVVVDLEYSPQSLVDNGLARPRQGILTGSKKVQIKPDGRADFTNLSMSEASTKHTEREFCLRFTLAGHNNKFSHITCLSTPFYAYSNSKVLTRRKNIQLEVLSKRWGSFQGGEKMHVVGNPFIKGPSLKLVFQCEHGLIPVSSLRRYSDTVLFFTAPPYPFATESNPADVNVSVMVTNDGRNYSQPLRYTYTGKFNHMRSFL